MSEELMSDNTFWRLFIIMILAMAGLAISLGVIASFAAKGVNERLDARSAIENTAGLAERLAPVGEFAATVSAPAAEVVVADLSGEEAYKSAGCSGCHANAGIGAPVVGNSGDWTSRIAKGLESLYNSAIGGIGTMPAKGGSALSDQSVRNAVDYMVNLSQ